MSIQHGLPGGDPQESAHETAPVPQLSVVIPTFNRRERLHRVLEALTRQTATIQFEVIVVSDGSTDGTNQYLQSDRVPISVVPVLQANAGPAAARNAGISAATAPLILFIDDDVVPDPELIEQHVRTHREAAGDIVVIGPMLTPSDANLSPWVSWEQHQLYKQYDAMRDGLWECTFRQFYTGNASVPRQRVLDVGCFDTNYRRAEDVELAFRLHRVGVGFTFVAGAKGYHFAERSFESWLATANQYGQNDVRFIEDGQDWLTTTLPREFRTRHKFVQVLTRYCVPRPRARARATSALRRIASRPKSLGRLQRDALSGLYNLQYYQGVSTGLGSSEQFLAFIDGQSASTLQTPRVVFVLEETLGHVTHGENLRRILGASTDLRPTFLSIRQPAGGMTARLPGFRNWTIRAGTRAGRAIRRERSRNGPIDALFIHTQVPAILNRRWMRRIPTIVSLDATPLQYDSLGEYYAHEASAARIEQLKKWLNVKCFAAARHIVTWSKWTSESLIVDYGVDPADTTVIAPGVDIVRWSAESNDRPEAPVSVLFVGGDLERKGGHVLLEAVRLLRADPRTPPFVTHIVTRSDVAADKDVFVHRDLAPNSKALIHLYRQSHIFCLPTFGDCLPMVLSEAGVAELALVSTDVGAIHEIVKHGETGLLVPPGDLDALVEALRSLITDAELRNRLATAAAKLIRQEFDARQNAQRICDLLVGITSSRVTR